MALQDIIAAIVSQADQEIEQHRAKHRQEISLIKEEAARYLASKKQEINQQKELKKKQLFSKAQAHASSLKRNSALQNKQELLNGLYEEVLSKMSALPEKDTEKILVACLKKLSKSGTIYPAKKHESIIKKLAETGFKFGEAINSKGGFLFESATQEKDFTFESIIKNYVRPATELEFSHSLFKSDS